MTNLSMRWTVDDLTPRMVVRKYGTTGCCFIGGIPATPAARDAAVRQTPYHRSPPLRSENLVSAPRAHRSQTDSISAAHREIILVRRGPSDRIEFAGKSAQIFITTSLKLSFRQRHPMTAFRATGQRPDLPYQAPPARYASD